MLKKFNIFQIALFIFAGLAIIAGIVASIDLKTSDGWIRGLVYALILIAIGLVSTPDTLSFSSSELSSASDGLASLFTKKGILGSVSVVDKVLIWVAPVLTLYYFIKLNNFVVSIPLIGGLLNSLIAVISSFRLYIFIFCVLSLVSKKKYGLIVLSTGLYLGVRVLDFVFDWFKTFKNGYFSPISSIPLILFLAIIFTIFLPHYTKTAGEITGS